MKYSMDTVKDRFNRKNDLDYLFFWGHQPSKTGSITKSCFSQWWIDSFSIDGIEYICMEQYMMAEKARLFKDYEILENILRSIDPKEIKAFGRQVRNFNDELWRNNRTSIVLNGNLAKFSQNQELKDFIIGTENKILVEASPYDKIWGIGLKEDDKNIENHSLWKGENLLGFALMEVRDALRAN